MVYASINLGLKPLAVNQAKQSFIRLVPPPRIRQEQPNRGKKEQNSTDFTDFFDRGGHGTSGHFGAQQVHQPLGEDQEG